MCCLRMVQVWPKYESGNEMVEIETGKPWQKGLPVLL